MKILVVGGACYIGSHMLKLLRKNHCDVIVQGKSGHRNVRGHTE